MTTPPQVQTVALDGDQIALIADLVLSFRRGAESSGDHEAAALCDTIIDELGAAP